MRPESRTLAEYFALNLEFRGLYTLVCLTISDLNVFSSLKMIRFNRFWSLLSASNLKYAIRSFRWLSDSSVCRAEAYRFIPPSWNRFDIVVRDTPKSLAIWTAVWNGFSWIVFSMSSSWRALVFLLRPDLGLVLKSPLILYLCHQYLQVHNSNKIKCVVNSKLNYENQKNFIRTNLHCSHIDALFHHRLSW